MGRRTKVCLGVVVLLACFFFLGRSLLVNWHRVDFQEMEFRWVFLLTSYVIWFIAVLVMALIWKASIMCVGENLRFLSALRIVCLSMLPRYLPGKVWGMMGQVWLTKKEAGIPGERGGISVVLSTAMSLLTGALLGLIILPSVLRDSLSKHIYLLFLVVPVLLALLHPSVFVRIVNFGLRKTRRKVINFVPTFAQLLRLLLLYMVFWLLQCGAIFFLIKFFYPINSSFLIPLCGAFPAAWVVGFLSLITPGGLGVREGALAYLLGFYMPTSIAIMASILIRIWATVAEVALFAIFARNLRRYL